MNWVKYSTRGIINIGLPCNFRCKHCYYDKSSAKRWKSQVKIFLNLMYLRAGRINSVDITGGEPSIYPHLVWLCRIAKLIGFKEVRLITNGYEVDNLERVRNNPIVVLAVSMHCADRKELLEFTGKDVLPRLVELKERWGGKIVYAITVPNPWIKNKGDVLVKIADILRPEAMCIKQLDYNCDLESIRSGGTGMEDKRWVVSEYIDELCASAIRVKKKYPAMRIDMKFWPLCRLSNDLMSLPGVRFNSFYNNHRDPWEWNPIMSKFSPWLWRLIFIFGWDSLREKFSEKAGMLESERQGYRQGKVRIGRCFSCAVKDCDGPFHGYVKKYGDCDMTPRGV